MPRPSALLAGYRHIDTAAAYRNEAAIEQLDAGERTGPDPDTFVRPPAQ